MSDFLRDRGKSNSLLEFANRLTENEKNVIKDLFNICDMDGDGQISKSELSDVVSLW